MTGTRPRPLLALYPFWGGFAEFGFPLPRPVVIASLPVGVRPAPRDGFAHARLGDRRVRGQCRVYRPRGRRSQPLPAVTNLLIRNKRDELNAVIASGACLPQRAREWAVEQVGAFDAAVTAVARALGVGWHRVMRRVVIAAATVIDAPTRLGGVSAVGVGETAYLRATGAHSTLFATD